MASDASSVCSEDESNVCEEELAIECEEAENEVADLQMELRAVEAEAKQLKMRLQAASSQCARTGRPAGPALGPAGAVALPTVAGGAEQKRLREIGALLEWLAEHTQLSGAELLEVGFEVPIGARVVHLRRVAQWPMPTAPSGRLRLSVPADHQESIAQLLSYIKGRGGKVDAQTTARFAAVWDLVPGELAAAAPPGGAPAAAAPPEPSVVLAHRACSQGILVATWPSREALEASGRLAGREAPAPWRPGERVEVEYQGAWFGGALQGVDAEGNIATIRCDADPEGVVTVAPVGRVRRPAAAPWEATGSASAAGDEESVAAPTSDASTAGDGEPGARSWHRRSRSSAL